MARLVAGSGGYAATVGGTVRIFGTTDVEVISLADTAGTVSFDGSFNRGGDFIILPNAANTYSISRVGSSVTLSDADSTITIPVGSQGSTLQFADGELILKFGGQVLLGSQVISAASATITATLSAKTALPAATSATGTLITSANEPVLIGGNVRIFGTNGPDTVTIADVPGNLRFDGSFNRGGDTIVLNKFAESYSAARPDPSNIMIGDGDTNLAIPLGIKGLNVAFANEERTLVYANKNAYIGNTIVNSKNETIASLEYNINYVYQKNAFTSTLPNFGAAQNRSISSTPIVFDFNNDGMNDILFVFVAPYPRTNNEILDGNFEMPNLLSIFINMGGHFVDKTEDFLIGERSIGGGYTSHLILDINSDGVKDIIFASKQEDGVRKNNSDFFGNLTALISKENQYEVIKFGERLWYQDLSSVTINQKHYILYSGYGGNDLRPYEFNNGLFQKSDIKIPMFDSNVYQYVQNNHSDRGYIIKNQSYPNLLGVEGWVPDAEGNWSLVGKINNPFEFVRDIQFTAWTSSESSTAFVYKDGDRYFLGGGGHTTMRVGTIKLFPDSEPIAVVKMEVPTIKNYDPSVGFITQVDPENKYEIVPANRLVGFQIKDGNIIKIDLVIDGYILEGVNDFNGTTIKDFNNDGYEDIVIQNFSYDAFPTVYLNQKDGTFSIFDDFDNSSEFLYFSPNTARSIIDDFNGDGIVDIITFPANFTDVSNPYSMADFRLYLASSSVGFG